MSKPRSRVRSTMVVAAICSLLLLAAAGGPLFGQAPELSEEEKREQVAAERFLDVLLKRPSTGTALDRVFGFHVARGDLKELLADLETRAEQAGKDGDKTSAGNHWVVVGLLQLQRGEAADAAQALAKAEEFLEKNPLAAHQHGEALLLLGRNDAAAEAMQRALDHEPPRQDFLAIATQLGRLHQRAGKTDAALAIWTKLEKTFPGDDGVRQRIARVLADEGDAEQALQRYDALAKDARSQNDRIVYALRAADLRVQLGQRDAATKDLEKLIDQLRPGSYLYAEARRRIEDAFLTSGDYAGLSDYYEKWIEKHADDVGAVLRLARVLSVQGRGAEALKWLQQAIERSPTDQGPRLALIDTHLALQQYKPAAEEYKKLAELEPNNADHLVRWGQIVLEDAETPKEQRVAAAADIWKKLADARPDDAVVQSQVADLLRGVELTDQAIAGYRNAIKLAPGEPQYREYLGEYLHRLDRHAEALPVWRSVAEGDLRTRENLIRLAEIMRQFDEPEEARKTMGQACELNPTLDERLRYAQWLREDSRLEEAFAQLQLAEQQTDTVDDRDRVFAASVETYQAAGELDKRIADARQAAETAQTDGELWRRLAVLHDAQRQTREALEAIEKAIEHSGDSISTLGVAARMYESAGRLQLAIEKRRQLADTDRRFRTGHLQRLANLYMRMGDHEHAFETGKDLLASSGGSIESFKLYADLCGQAGRTEERLDTLRRCLRVNPRSAEAQQLLARQLADDFKSEQAIELYWNMLESATELDARRQVVQSLTDLYLRLNRVDQLISRLEIRGRESGDRRTTIDLVATVHEHAGDLGLARDALESLFREQGRDTLLLERLVALAEKAGESEDAVELQRQLLRLAPGRQNEAKLASLLIDIGSISEAEALWLRISEQDSDAQQAVRNINRLFAAQETAMALRLAEKGLEHNPDDWHMQLNVMILQAAEGQWDKAAETAQRLRAMKVPESTLPAGGKPYQQTVTIASTGQVYQQPPLKIMRTRIYEMLYILDARYGRQQRVSLPLPLDFGHARVMALYVLTKHALDNGELPAMIETAEQEGLRDGASADDIWNWYYVTTIASQLDSSAASRVSYDKPDTWKPLWKLAELDREAGSYAVSTYLSNRHSVRSRNVVGNLIALGDDRLEWLKQRAADDVEGRGAATGRNQFSWPMFYDSELRIAGREDEAKGYSNELVEVALRKQDATQAAALVMLASNDVDDDRLWQLLEVVRRHADDPLVQQRVGKAANLYCLSTFASHQRIDQKATKGPKDAAYRERIATLVEAAIADEAVKPVRSSSLRLTGLGQPRNSYIIRSGSYQESQITFPPSGIGPNDSFIQSLWNIHNLLEKHSAECFARLSKPLDDADPRVQILRQTVAGMLLQWNERTGEAVDVISRATQLAAVETPHLEPDLRLMWVDLLLRQGNKQRALEVVEGLNVHDQNTMAVREFAAARLAAALGDKERAQSAVKRLFGVRLDSGTQIELARLMRSLEMHELATDLVRRMRTRGGSNTDQLSSLMTYFASTGESDQAAEVAIELLRRTVPQRNASPNYTTAAQVRRREALQTLAGVGRLTALIDATKQRFERSPNSQRIRGELGEMYTAAGKTAEAQELLAELAGGDTNSLAALEQVAKQLVAGGKMDEACDAYLKVLRRKPELFEREYYELKRPFEQTKRLGELADLIIEAGVQKFQDYRVAYLVGEMFATDDKNPKARALMVAILDSPAPSSNSMHGVNSVLSRSRNLFKDEELLTKTQSYLIKTSLRTQGGWNVLFQGYSYGADGRHTNGAMSLLKVVADDETRAQAFEDQIRKSLSEHEDWYEGRAWLGTFLAVRKRYDEAQQLLEPLLDEKTQPAPTFTAFWLIGSVIDEHPPLQELALRMYRHSIDKHRVDSVRLGGAGFEYSLVNRACQLLKQLDRKSEARQLLLDAVALREKAPARSGYQPDYEAHRKIQDCMSTTKVLDELGYPVDALRMARTMDMSWFDTARRYGGNSRESFIAQRDKLVAEVRKLGGVETVNAMIDAETERPFAVDLVITVGEQPFSKDGLDCLWLQLLKQDVADPKNADALKVFVQTLGELRTKRPKDDSAAFAHAIAADVAGERESLRALIAEWGKPSEAETVDDQAFRQQCLIVAGKHLAQAAPDGDASLVEELVSVHAPKWTWENRLLLLAELGKGAIRRGDLDSARRYWGSLVEGAPSQILLIDLAHAAAEADLPDLSLNAAEAAASAPDQALNVAAGATNTKNLGTLLATSRNNAAVARRGQNEGDPAEARLINRLFALDEIWKTRKADPSQIFDAYMHYVFAKDDTAVRPFCLPASVGGDHTVTIDSIFDRMAKRAHEAGRTDDVLSRLKGDDPTSRLLTALVLLRGEQSAAAREQLAAATTSDSVAALTAEAVLQVLLPALEDDACREEAIRIGRGLVEANMPTERYQQVSPFDALAYQLARTAFKHGHADAGLALANDYLKITEHDNARYSGGDYGIRRRVTQLNDVCTLLLPTGDFKQVLDFAAMRQSIFDLGHDRMNDTGGLNILQHIWSFEDRQAAYQTLAEWTFAGDGSLRVITALAQRPTLPDWAAPLAREKSLPLPPLATEAYPIASSWYLLIKLADETGSTGKLLDRLRQAHDAGRGNAAEALALALGVTGESLPAELLTRIDQNLESIAPASGRPTTAAPMHVMHLATVLAERPEHVEWAKATAMRFEAHGQPVTREYIVPLLNLYRYRQEWTDDSNFKNVEATGLWLRSSATYVAEYAKGLHPAVWVTDGAGRLNHICGVSNDRLWFRYPLEGDFEFQADIEDDDGYESGLFAAGIRYGASGNNRAVDFSVDSGRDSFLVSTSVMKTKDWNKYTIRFKGELMTLLINDTIVYEEPRRSASPWLAFLGDGRRLVRARNIGLTGTPRIPQSLDLLAGEELRDWGCDYYNQQLPTGGLSTTVREAGASGNRQNAAPPASDVAQLAWTLRDGELISGDSPRRGPAGQSVIHYDRPLGEGETFSYEFFYEAGKSEVHPAVERTAFLLQPDGVKRHWMTEPGNFAGLPDDNEVAADASGPAELPLKEGEWNRVAVHFAESKLRIHLNDTLVFDKKIEVYAQGTIFGFFGYADKTKARIRNATLTGPWPENVPENMLEFENQLSE